MDNTSSNLQGKYGGTWGNHPVHTVADWRYEVANDDTRLGYWDWVVNQIDLETLDIYE